MLARTFASTIRGVDAALVVIEVNIVNGTGCWMVGLPDNAIKESQHRIESAIKETGYAVPRRRVIINLAPAGLRKEGAAYDLPIALGMLHASGQISLPLMSNYMVLGELALDGTLRPVRGVLPAALCAQVHGCKGVLLPTENAQEAAIVAGLEVIPVDSLQGALDFLSGKKIIEPLQVDTKALLAQGREAEVDDFADVQGQGYVKRALEVAAAGGHNVLLIGPPGAGKTMLAKRSAGILPPLMLEEALETTKIYSVAGKVGAQQALMVQRPFRAPHHTISDVALVGGGGPIPQCGELALAHNGVLFLDELPEFKRGVLEVMRQPLEEKYVTIARAKLSVDFPTNFMLIASMNPCPCGYYNHPEKSCVCLPGAVQRYMNKISGPLLDRIDLHIEVTPVPFAALTQPKPNESSAQVRMRVVEARKRQQQRFLEYRGVHTNSMIPPKLMQKVCAIDEAGRTLLKQATARLSLSARAYDRILRVARTIADLAGNTHIGTAHLAEAIQYRTLDRAAWTSGLR